VKRRDLERHLRAEIKLGLPVAICKQLDVPPPPNPR
jgi:hypothetical protein